jgi:hypothetical protein
MRRDKTSWMSRADKTRQAFLASQPPYLVRFRRAACALAGKWRSGRPRRLAVLTAVALAGGTMFGTCQARIRDSVVNGTQLFILNLFDPANVVVTDE